MADEESASSRDLVSPARKLQVPHSHPLVDIMLSAGNSIAAGLGLVDPVAGVVGGTVIQALGTGWALFNERHVKDFLEAWLEDYVAYTTVTDRLRSDVDQQRQDLERQRAGLDDAKETIADLEGRLGDAAYATINHIVEVVRRTAHEEKLTALRNAALHVALGDGPDQALQDILLSMVDSLTDLHIQLLDALINSPKYGIPVVNSADFNTIGGTYKVISEHVPGFERRDILERCINDLINQRLVYYQGGEQIPDASLLELMSVLHPTGLGYDFVMFISRPKDLAHADQPKEQGS